MKKTLLLFLSFSIFCNAQTQIVLAGSTDSGFSEGITGRYATFNKPFGIARGSDGFFYVADTFNNCIRKISSDGSIVTTIAGSINSDVGSNDGLGTAAKFYNPAGIVVDQTGNIFVADTRNHRIRKITPSGIVTTFAGSTQGYANGNGSIAKFDNPFGLTIDSFGNLYVADSAVDNQDSAFFGSIRKITPTGLVSTFYTISGLRPTGVCIDTIGNIYVTSMTSYLVYKVNSNGQLISTFNANSSLLGIAIDLNGNMYVTTKGNLPSSCPFNNPLICLPYNASCEIRKITPNNYVTIEVASGLNSAFGLATDNNNDVFIADMRNNRIAKLSSGVLNNFTGVNYSELQSAVPSSHGCVSSEIYDGLGEINKAQFNNPYGIGKDSNGNIYIADTYNHRIRKITPSGVVSTLVGSVAGMSTGLSNQALLNHPRGIFVDGNDNIYTFTTVGIPNISPLTDVCIRKISTTGTVSGFPENNPNLVIQNITFKNNLIVDQSGNVFYTNFKNQINKVTTNGVVSLFAGDFFGTSGYVDGQGATSRFNNTRGLCIDPDGNIYVADSGNNRIRKITSTGMVSTLAYNTSILFDSPGNLAFNAGSIYFTEGGNYDPTCSLLKIKKITSANQAFLVCDNCGGAGSIMAGPNCMYVISGNQINIVNDQALEINSNFSENYSLIIFPNPAKDQITIDCESMKNVIGGDYEIVNLLGQIVIHGTIESNKNVISLNSINNSGVYILKVYDNSKKIINTQKIIKY